MLNFYSLRIYGEGGKDEKFWQIFCETNNFIHHHERWSVESDSNSGGNPISVVDGFIKSSQGVHFDLALVFCDIDKIEDTKKTKEEIEEIYLDKHIRIIWQDKDFEEEVYKINPKMKKKTKEKGDKGKTKERINKWACDNVSKFINSELDKKIKIIIKERENVLDNDKVI